MNKEQKALFNELTSLQKKIALNSFSGMSDIDSYKASNGKAKTIKAMEASVSQILSNLKVRAFLDSLSKEVVSSAIMSRQEMLEELSVIARTNSNDLIEWGYRDVEVANKETGETEIQHQSYWSLKSSEEINPDHMKAIEEVTAGRDGLKFKRTSKLLAMKQIADIEGFNSASKHEHTSPDGSMSPDGLSTEERQDRIKMLLAKQGKHDI